MADTADERKRLIQAGSFGAAAEAYERGRPQYPADAVSWLLRDTGRRVLDLGAGTGKLTRQLCSQGLDVTAVEPSQGMREQLVAMVPQARTLEGTAESIPLPNASMDAALVAQAWHWVDTRRAVPEVARVLAPGGVLGLVWNMRDERDTWNARLGRLLHPDGTPTPTGPSTVGLAERPDLFDTAEHLALEWRYTITRDELIDLVSSRSYVITMSDTERADLLAAVEDLAAHHPAPARQNRLDMPYITHCYRARRRHNGAL